MARPRKYSDELKPNAILGLKPGPTTEELAEIKASRQEVADHLRTTEILEAATSFVQEADPCAR